MNYAKATMTDCFPKKDQAVVLDSIEGITTRDYVFEIAKLTSPANIRFVSRISNSRICLYLATKQIADELLDKKIILKDNALAIRPLISRAKRIILSNVCPVIPHEFLENELRKLHIKLESRMSFVKCGISEPGFAHISSFRRQIYISPTDIPKIPKSLNIQYEDTSYWIYLSNSETLSCFVCQQEGHLARQCPTTVQKTAVVNIENQLSQNEIFINPEQIIPDKNLPASPEKPPTSANTFKRPHSDSSSAKSTFHTENFDFKTLSDSNSSIDQLLENSDSRTQKTRNSKKKPQNPAKKEKQSIRLKKIKPKI